MVIKKGLMKNELKIVSSANYIVPVFLIATYRVSIAEREIHRHHKVKPQAAADKIQKSGVLKYWTRYLSIVSL